WDAAIGACRQTLDIGRTLLTISFNPAGSHLHTEIGTIDLDMPSTLYTAPSATTQKPLGQGYGISSDGTWITWCSENLLWLPSEYRPSCSAVVASAVAIGCPSGRVLIMKFS
ncbi:hypothetical protein QBC46DRAFT_225081, partial [Diplogelasinospora grovesii]